MTDRKRKRIIISLSSSSSSSEEEEEEEEEEENDDDDDYEEEEDGVRTSIDYSEEEEEEDNESDNENDGANEDALWTRVISLLRGGKNLEALSLKACKAYLRKYGLRLAGTKAVCMQRIKEHWRIKDGNGESLYPRSSFVINCTGDVCKGDVVLFTQKVYEKFDKVTRHGNLLGKRTVAGRVVKESYGSAKQQHTFTVEVLWNKGIKKLPPLFPLLVKGRNLYKLKTFRQRWNNEVERLKVLDEKHKRGRAARFVRAMKKSKKRLSANGGMEHRKCSHHDRPSQTRKTVEPGKNKFVYGRKKDTLQQHAKVNNHHQEVPPSRPLNLKRNSRSDVDSETTWRHLKRGRLNMDMDPVLHSHAYYRQGPCPSHKKFHQQTVPYHFSGHDMGSTSTMMKLPPLRPYADTVVMPALQHRGFNFERSNLNHFSELIDADRPFHQFPHGMEKYGKRTKGFQSFRR